MSEPFLGELRLVPYNFAPVGWALADGQALSISSNQALFALLGTTYGGNGTTTFNLPDLRGRVPVSSGQASGGSNYTLGQTFGVESNKLTVAQLPAHSHAVSANSNKGTQTSPIGGYPALCEQNDYGTSSTGAMNAGMIANTGSGQAIENRPPGLVLNWIIALAGIFPSRG